MGLGSSGILAALLLREIGGGEQAFFEDSSIATVRPHKSPLNGRWTILSIALAVSLGLASLLFFLSPSQIADSFANLSAKDLAMGTVFYLLGCWITVERWRACLSYRADRWLCFHTMGVAHAGNLLIPGRVGEALRIFLLSRFGVAAEYGTSGVVQERLADNLLRILFLGGAVLLFGVTHGAELSSRLLGVTLATVLSAIVLLLLIRARRGVADRVGSLLGRLPWLRGEAVSSYVYRTLTDLSQSWTHPGGKIALLWGLLAWLAFTVHTEFILESFFSVDTLAMALILLAFTPATAPTQPGLYHGLVLAALVMVGADKVPAVQAAVVLHMFQMVVLTIWGSVSWLVLQRRLKAASVGLKAGSVRVLE